MEFIQQIGALAGLAAFVGLAVLAMLYFGQAKDVRRLRESASFLVEGGEAAEVEAPTARSAAQPAAAAKPAKGKGKVAAAPQKKPTDAEAFRRAELARQATERRERFERRRGTGRHRISRGGEGRFSSLPEPRALAVIVVGAALLAAGVVFIATGALSGDGDGASSTKSGVVPSETQVAVLNSTSESGLAADSARKLKQLGYNVDPVANASIPFETSAVMFEKRGELAAKEIARQLKFPAPKPLVDQVRPEAAGAIVIVLLGEDMAGGA
jgi:hypothetical protein